MNIWIFTRMRKWFPSTRSVVGVGLLAILAMVTVLAVGTAQAAGTEHNQMVHSGKYSQSVSSGILLAAKDTQKPDAAGKDAKTSGGKEAKDSKAEKAKRSWESFQFENGDAYWYSRLCLFSSCHSAQTLFLSRIYRLEWRRAEILLENEEPVSKVR